MPTQVTNYQCPACTGPLHFVGASGKLECDYCGSTYDVAEIEALYAEKEAKAREKAEAKLDANRLTNRIIAALTERRLGKENAVTIENPDEEDDANNDNEN